MENIIKEFDAELKRYNDVMSKIQRITTEIAMTEEDITENIPARIRYLQNHLEFLPKYKAKLENELADTMKEALNIQSSWIGTFIKDDEPETVAKGKHIGHHSRKMQMPCGNHTYKDLLCIKDKPARKAEKIVKQKQIVECYALSAKERW